MSVAFALNSVNESNPSLSISAMLKSYLSGSAKAALSSSAYYYAKIVNCLNSSSETDPSSPESAIGK